MIWRVHTLLDQSVEYYTTSQFGINMNSTLAECKQTLGELTSEETLNWNGISRRFEITTSARLLRMNLVSLLKWTVS